MKKTTYLAIASALVLITALCFAEALKEGTDSKPQYSIRKVDEQTVLYTIYRGPYENLGQPIGKLFALAGQNGLYPKGSLSCCYLNNPQLVAKEHYLTEIRIPVDKKALELVGKLGEMTDVKTIPAIEMAVTKKTKDNPDPSPLYTKMYTWIYKNGYTNTGNPSEVFSSMAMNTNYAQMETEIMVPVMKIAVE